MSEGPSGTGRPAGAHRPRRAFRWTAYVLAVTSFGAAIPTPLYPIYEQQFQFSAGVLGLVFGAYAAGVLLTLFVVAPQAERLGRRNLLYLAMGLMALSAAVFALAPNVAWLAIARVLSGMAVGATTSVATAAMTDLEPYRDHHHVARVAVAANFGGFAVGVLLSGLLVQYLPSPTHLVYLLPLVASGIGVFAIRNTPETGTAIGTPRVSWVQRIAIPAECQRSFWVAAGGVAACYSIYGFFAALAPSYIRSGLGITNALGAGAIIALMFGTAALIQLVTAQVRDRRALLVGLPLLLVTLVALVLSLRLASWALLAVVAAALGAAVGLTFMGSVTLVDRVAPENSRGELLAGFYAAGYLSLAVPTLGVAEASGVIGLANAGVVLGVAVALAVALLYVSTYRTPTPPGGGGRPPEGSA